MYLNRSEDNFNTKLFSDLTPTDIKPYLAKTIIGESSLPNVRLWKKAPTAEDAEIEKYKRIRFLGKHEDDHPATILAKRLSKCGRKKRCFSGACPECARLLQRWFVRS